MAIVNPAHIKPYAEILPEQRQLAEDLIFNRHEEALSQLVTYFENVEDSGDDQERGKIDLDRLSPEERLHWRILHRHKTGVEADIHEILARDPHRLKAETAVAILNDTLLPAMKDVGDKFGSGELILPLCCKALR